MDWLQRYVDNVKTYLPGGQREDIGSELYSDLRDQCDDMAESLGRQPTEAEVLALLKQRGHPMTVAAAFRPRRSLISEPLFPLYCQVLKWIFLALVIANGTVAGLDLVDRAQLDFTGALFNFLRGLYESSLYSFAWVTLVFFLAGESISYSDFFGKWDPRKLPRVAGGGRGISQFESAVELVVMLVLMAWLNGLFVGQESVGGVQFNFSAGLVSLLPWLNIAAGASILMALDKLFRPFWTRPRLAIDAAINAAWLILLALLFNLEQVFTIQWSGEDARQWAMPLNNWKITIAIVMAIVAYDLFNNLRRLTVSRQPE